MKEKRLSVVSQELTRRHHTSSLSYNSLRCSPTVSKGNVRNVEYRHEGTSQTQFPKSSETYTLKDRLWDRQHKGPTAFCTRHVSNRTGEKMLSKTTWTEQYKLDVDAMSTVNNKFEIMEPTLLFLYTFHALFSRSRGSGRL